LLILQDFLARLDGVKQSGSGYIAHCPHHEDKQQSLGINEGTDGRILLNCFAGCETRDIVAAMGLQMKDLFPAGDNIIPNGQNSNKSLTVAELAQNKGLPTDFLQSLEVENFKYGVKITYRDVKGKLAPRQRYRTALKAKDGSTWARGNGKPIFYGSWLIGRMAEKHGYITFVEGETDAWTLWYHDLPALGVPGAEMTNKLRRGHIEDFSRVYIWQEPDQGGEAFVKGLLKGLAKLDYKGDVFIIQCSTAKDPNELHLKLLDRPGTFLENWHELIDKARRVDLSGQKENNTENVNKSGKCAKFANGANFTDLGNARRMVKLYGQYIRYSHESKKWYLWNKKHWEVDNTGEIKRLAKETIKDMYREAAEITDDDIREALVNHALKSESDGRLKAMVSLAESEPGIPVLQEQFDRNHFLLNCLNGTVDLRTGELKEPRQADYITKLAPVNYDPQGVKNELWENFLERILPDPNVREFVQRAAGYSLTGDISEEVLFFAYGPPATGKSTFLAAIKAVMGDYAATSDFEAFLAQNRSGGPRNDIARLAGKRFVISLEVEDGRRLAENLINHITGGDEVTARHLYQESFEFIPQFKLWLAANNQPRVAGTDGAIWRRILQIPFDQQIPKLERNPKLKTLLRNTKKSGSAILAWLIKGCMSWQQNGLNPPGVVLQATEDYKQDMDPLADFIADFCVATENAQTKNSELWKAYSQWCKQNGEKYPLGRKKFSQVMMSKGFDQYNDGKSRIWIGIGLVNYEEAYTC